MGPHIDECAAEWSSWHSDVEVGRCVAKHVGIACMLEPYTRAQLKARFKTYWKDGQMSYLPEVLPIPYLDAISLHPVKPRAPRYATNHMDAVRKQMEAGSIMRK
jgi:hypothetical protein